MDCDPDRLASMISL